MLRWRLWQKAWAYSTIESSGNNINRCALGETLESSRSCCSPAAATTIRVSPIAPARAVQSTGDIDWFTDRGKDTGIDFVHVNGMSGQFYMTEIMAPGVALFDYDNDGDLDIYLVQGSG